MILICACRISSIAEVKCTYFLVYSSCSLKIATLEAEAKSTRKYVLYEGMIV